MTEEVEEVGPLVEAVEEEGELEVESHLPGRAAEDTEADAAMEKRRASAIM